jgi:hypothetical protein
MIDPACAFREQKDDQAASPQPSEAARCVSTGSILTAHSHLLQNMSQFIFLGSQIFNIGVARLNLDRHALDHFQPVAFDPDDFSRVVRNQLDLV